MFEIIALIVTTGGIAGYARARGGNPWLWGSLSLGGHLLIQFVGGMILGILGYSGNQDAIWILIVASWAWIGVIALCTRFLLGIRHEKPSGMWSCPNCKYLNQHYAVICEACQQPYATPARDRVTSHT
jgi:hypothetical protein